MQIRGSLLLLRHQSSKIISLNTNIQLNIKQTITAPHIRILNCTWSWGSALVHVFFQSFLHFFFNSTRLIREYICLSALSRKDEYRSFILSIPSWPDDLTCCIPIFCRFRPCRSVVFHIAYTARGNGTRTNPESQEISCEGDPDTWFYCILLGLV